MACFLSLTGAQYLKYVASGQLQVYKLYFTICIVKEMFVFPIISKLMYVI